MALYLLNISVDTTESGSSYVGGNLNPNEQESIVEIVLEKILGIEDAITESEDSGTGDFNKRNKLKVVFGLSEVIHFENNFWQFNLIYECPSIEFMVSRLKSAPESPPPEFCLFL